MCGSTMDHSYYGAPSKTDTPEHEIANKTLTVFGRVIVILLHSAPAITGAFYFFNNSQST